MSRLRKVLLAAFATLLALGIYTLFIEPGRLVVRSESIAAERWPASYAPLRVVLLADLHAGAPFITEKKIAELVRLTNEQHPDFVFLLGDYVIQGVIGGRFIPPERTAALLAGLEPRFGTFAVIGNHDAWLDKARVRKALETNGIRVLENETVQVRAGDREIVLAGLADLWTGKPDYSILRAPDGVPLLALTHNPDLFPNVPPHVALTLAGHTHGGQVALPLAGRLVVPSKFGKRYAIGHIVENGRHLYVTSGVGTSIIPVRFRVVPEVRVLEIRSPSPPATRPSPATAPRSTP